MERGSGIPASWLKTWLGSVTRSDPKVALRHFHEVTRPDEAAESLAEMIRSSKGDMRRLRRLLERASFLPGSARLRPPKTVQLRHGDFGEVLTIGLIETSTHLRVPVIKLRSQVDADQSLHGTDIVGFALVEDPELRVIDLDFVEVKVRTSGRSNAKNAAVEAHEQLLEDRRVMFSDVLEFIAQRLEESDPELSRAFDDYLADRDGPDGTNRIVIVIEEDDYHQDILSNLTDRDNLCDPLAVDFVRLDGLADLIRETWELVPKLGLDS